MLFDRKVTKELWNNINERIIELGMVNYNLSNTKTLIGDLENALAVKSIILLTKKIIYNAMKKEENPHTSSVENNVIFILIFLRKIQELQENEEKAL